ncbi:hypothetical protein HNY73_022062 [Argiope bruennichi]|uniref:Uncharacterized protein n=1 Tax=Argiope bruennichi TaxID=94029 RepID=A0A8T0E3V1_ARGBR|nr:hypothetical protein HNY73_022062 [Argiope bruennichi]
MYNPQQSTLWLLLCAELQEFFLSVWIGGGRRFSSNKTARGGFHVQNKDLLLYIGYRPDIDCFPKRYLNLLGARRSQTKYCDIYRLCLSEEQE